MACPVRSPVAVASAMVSGALLWHVLGRRHPFDAYLYHRSLQIGRQLHSGPGQKHAKRTKKEPNCETFSPGHRSPDLGVQRDRARALLFLGPFLGLRLVCGSSRLKTFSTTTYLQMFSENFNIMQTFPNSSRFAYPHQPIQKQSPETYGRREEETHIVKQRVQQQ